MSALKRTVIAAVVVAAAAVATPAAKAAADWRAETYCPTAVTSPQSISLDTRLGTMFESDPCKVLGFIVVVR